MEEKAGFIWDDLNIVIKWTLDGIDNIIFFDKDYLYEKKFKKTTHAGTNY